MEKTPILKLRDRLLVPIQTELHDRAATEMQDCILNAIERHRARAVIIDISVLDIVDSFIGRILSDTARMAAVMGAEVIMVGMQPAVAITLVELGMELEDVRTALNLETAMELFDAAPEKDPDSAISSGDPAQPAPLEEFATADSSPTESP